MAPHDTDLEKQKRRHGLPLLILGAVVALVFAGFLWWFGVVSGGDESPDYAVPSREAPAVEETPAATVPAAVAPVVEAQEETAPVMEDPSAVEGAPEVAPDATEPAGRTTPTVQ